jgi:hypothetical protein
MTQEEFLKDIDTWCNHRVLLYEALELTKDSPYGVCEFGAGHGSTPFLRQYCKDANRTFVSYENDKEWADKVGSTFIDNFLTADIYTQYSVVLVDFAPGESRHEAVAILKDLARIIVIHDSEEGGSGNYMYSKIYPLFKYRKDYNITEGGAGATMLSNYIDFNPQKDANDGNVNVTNSETESYNWISRGTSDEIPCKTGHAVNGIVPGDLDIVYDQKICDCGRVQFFKEMCGCPTNKHYELKQKENI